MRQRNVKNQDVIIENADKVVKNPETFKGKWKDKKKQLLYLEIGMGKGAFLSEIARINKKNICIGIEINKGVLSLAIKKIQRTENDLKEKINNLKIIALNAEKLEEIFSKGEVDKIYLNFSDPWPKTKHEKRRLTSDKFLNIYKNILKKDGTIEIKTDNRNLFEYTLQNVSNNEMIIQKVWLNLHDKVNNNNIEKQDENHKESAKQKLKGKIVAEEYNVMTEYEEKFKEKGPIYKMIARFK